MAAEAEIKSSPLRLVRPGIKYARSFCEMAEEFQRAGETRYESVLPLLREDFPAYLRLLAEYENPRTVSPGRVPQSEFWLVDRESQKVLGNIRLRHALNPRLEQIGGHIGYTIRPSERRKGYGTRMLAMLLDRLKKAGWDRVLITCNSDNLGSARIIEANGGCLEDQRLNESEGKLVNRYWIILNRSLHVPE